MLCLHAHSPPIEHRDLKSANLLLDGAWSVKVRRPVARRRHERRHATAAALRCHGLYIAASAYTCSQVADFSLSKLAPPDPARSSTTARGGGSGTSFATADSEPAPSSPGSPGASSPSTQPGALNPRWAAPELLTGSSTAGLPADVYAFGVVLWELLTWKLPWADTPNPWTIVNATAAGGRPAIPDPEALPGPAPAGAWGGLPAYLGLMQRCWAQVRKTRCCRVLHCLLRSGALSSWWEWGILSLGLAGLSKDWRAAKGACARSQPTGTFFLFVGGASPFFFPFLFPPSALPFLLSSLCPHPFCLPALQSPEERPTFEEVVGDLRSLSEVPDAQQAQPATAGAGTASGATFTALRIATLPTAASGSHTAAFPGTATATTVSTIIATTAASNSAGTSPPTTTATSTWADFTTAPGSPLSAATLPSSVITTAAPSEAPSVAPSVVSALTPTSPAASTMAPADAALASTPPVPTADAGVQTDDLPGDDLTGSPHGAPSTALSGGTPNPPAMKRVGGGYVPPRA